MPGAAPEAWHAIGVKAAVRPVGEQDMEGMFRTALAAPVIPQLTLIPVVKI